MCLSAGLTPDPSQAGPQVFDLEAEQTEQTTAEASRMDSELGPQASDEAAEVSEAAAYRLHVGIAAGHML